jgi:non-ribosomal peptide synthetase component F
MPLDPSWPAHRLQQVCTAARPTALVWSAVEACCGGRGCPEVTGVTLLELPPLAGLLQHTLPRGRHLEPGTSLAQQQALGHARGDGLEHEQACCYILFTSGSTGRPLGVRGTEAGIINRCRWMQEACPFQVLAELLRRAELALLSCSVKPGGLSVAGLPGLSCLHSGHNPPLAFQNHSLPSLAID